jgi:parallel beta-helix repeat protein
MIIQVGNASELQVALVSAAAGDLIKLAAGDYGSVLIKNREYSGTVTIESADLQNPATFGSIKLQNVSNLTIRNAEIDKIPAIAKAVEVIDSDHVIIDNMDIHGDVTLTVPAGLGVAFLDSTNVQVTNSELHHLKVGVSHSDSQYITVAHNDIHDIREDGMHGGGSSDVTIVGNSFTSFYPETGDHADAIQFWTVNVTTVARNIVIQDNLVVRGAGDPMQGIFMKDESTVLPYQNVTISGNVLVGTMYHGITLYHGDGVNVTNNTVVGYSDQNSWILLNDTVNSQVVGNTTTTLKSGTGNTGLVVQGNQIVSNPAVGDLSATVSWQSSHSTGPSWPIVMAPAPLVVLSPPAAPVSATTPVAIAATPQPAASNPGGDLAGVPASILSQLPGGGYATPAPAAPAAAPSPPSAALVVSGGMSVSGSGELRGSEYNDTVTGGASDDALWGGAGDDKLLGGEGRGFLRGEEGNDTLTGGSEFDDIHGNEGDDVASGGRGDDWVIGGQGNDRLAGDDGGDILQGNIGNDIADGGAGDDIVRGGQGNDELIGGAGADWLSGDRGDDTLTGGDGADTFHTFGAAGLDRVMDFSFPEGDRVQVAADSVYSVSQVGTDTVIDVAGGATMVLVGVNLASLGPGWILGG